MSPDAFTTFHEEVHGYPPFKWQQRLLEQVVETRQWPEVLDLPTGAGKTTCLDIALFALALNAGEQELWCPRRVAMVVDRRVVVDQVAERGRKLARALRSPKTPTVRQVAERLAGLSRDSEPLGVFTLRGGMPRDDGWARSPDQPLIIASTVDQLGSRMLMQGYGVSPGMAPVHAGLLANDILVLLDEVHLSEPFAETLQQLKHLRARFARTLPSRFHVAFLSATPVSSGAAPFRLSSAELEPNGLLGQRLGASKPARLVEAADRQVLEKVCVDEAASFVAKHQAVAVVLNRVNSATVVALQLREAIGEEADVCLLTGRMRPLDRDDLLRSLRPRIEAGRQRNNGDRKLVVVATQCIEAGADFDFDALVTEAASLSALRQRFGRVDRLGAYRESEGVIVRDKSAKEDPIYGDALQSTWRWLGERATSAKKKKSAPAIVDFGVLALEPPEAEELASLLGPSKHAPVLLPKYFDLWSQTSPAPALIPDVSLFLHGPESGPADVQVVWRADVTEELLTEDRLDEAVALVAAVRPSSLEALSLPFSAAKRWLSGERTGDVVDVEGVDTQDDESVGGRRALRWMGDESRLVSASEFRPGDTLIIPAARGGLRDGCFDPVHTEPVPDLAERATLFARGQAVLRLEPAILRAFGLVGLADILRDEGMLGCREAFQTTVFDEPWKRAWVEQLGKGRRIPVFGERPGLLLGKPLPRQKVFDLARGGDHDTIEPGVDSTTDEEGSSFLGRAVPLREHSIDVRDFAKAFASQLRLPPEFQTDLALAGWLHDIGKADRRFQILLRQGDEVEFIKNAEPLAKSGMSSGAREARRRASLLSGYPRGARHEVQSLAMLLNDNNVAQVRARSKDLELVLHLVASHHGYCRPLAPVLVDENPVDVSLHSLDDWSFDTTSSSNGQHLLDSDIPTRFWNLQRRLGWLELCWLEAILRLADHRASEAEQLREDQ